MVGLNQDARPAGRFGRFGRFRRPGGPGRARPAGRFGRFGRIGSFGRRVPIGRFGSSGRFGRIGIAVLLLAAFATACSPSATPSPIGDATPVLPTAIANPDPADGRPAVLVYNATTLAVTIVVNGTQLGVVPAGQDGSLPIVAGADAIPLPWRIQAWSPAGRLLVQVDVPAGTVITGTQGVGGRAELVCGRLDVYMGPPMLGPAPNPADLAPCR